MAAVHAGNLFVLNTAIPTDGGQRRLEEKREIANVYLIFNREKNRNPADCQPPSLRANEMSIWVRRALGKPPDKPGQGLDWTSLSQSDHGRISSMHISAGSNFSSLKVPSLKLDTSISYSSLGSEIYTTPSALVFAVICAEIPASWFGSRVKTKMSCQHATRGYRWASNLTGRMYPNPRCSPSLKISTLQATG